MPVEFKLPDLGEGIHEAEIIEVLVAVGDEVEDGHPVLIAETDKATTEVPSPVTGTVKEIRVKPGQVVKVGEVLMVFEAAGEISAAAGPTPVGAIEAPLAAKLSSRALSRPGSDDAGHDSHRLEEQPQPVPRPAAESTGPVPAAPSTRRLARELGVDLHLVTPTGAGGRVTPEDLRAYAEKPGKALDAPLEVPAGAEEAPPTPAPTGVPRPVVAVPPSVPRPPEEGPVEKEPLRSIRRATARHMALAWSQIPHVSHEDVVDITDLEAFRQKHKEEIRAQGGALSLTVFALKAAVAALKAFPRFNASLDMEAEEIILKKYYNIGVAVDTDRGLIVPVLRDVDRKSLTELSRELVQLAGRTREGKAGVEDMAGATFTITNIGVLGGRSFAPIVSYPQVAILGLGQARLEPVIRGDLRSFKVVPRLMLPLIIAFDHRVVDGADAARFMNMVKAALEDPEKLLMVM